MSEKYGLLIDYKYCSGCHTCEVACKREKGLKEGEWGIKLLEKGPFKIGEGIHDAWDWSYVPVPTSRCDLCEERVSAGEKPACVKHCLAFCMDWGPMSELAEKASAADHQVAIFLP
ncbi:MAG: oxidoreductase [Gordonibacter sp.]|uniref:oxidoreductase n=1 Tax=Gordonibacter sp. TaxID=1968902 RepID=UPI002FCAC829